MIPGGFSWLFGFYGFSRFQVGFSWFQVGFHAFSRFQVGFSRSLLHILNNSIAEGPQTRKWRRKRILTFCGSTLVALALSFWRSTG